MINIDYERRRNLWRSNRHLAFQKFPDLTSDEQIEALFFILRVTQRDFLYTHLKKWGVPSRTHLYQILGHHYEARNHITREENQIEAVRIILTYTSIIQWFEALIREYPFNVTIGILEEVCRSRNLNMDIPLIITLNEQNT